MSAQERLRSGFRLQSSVKVSARRTLIPTVEREAGQRCVDTHRLCEMHGALFFHVVVVQVQRLEHRVAAHANRSDVSRSSHWSDASSIVWRKKELFGARGQFTSQNTCGERRKEP
eukprot:2337042-Rhodomonas_salina.3